MRTLFGWHWFACLIILIGLIRILEVGREKTSSGDIEAKTESARATGMDSLGAHTPDFELRPTIGKGRARFHLRLERWQTAFLATVPAADLMLNPGMTADEMEVFEEWAGRVPPDLRRLLLRHNGQDPNSTPVYGIDRLLSSEKIATESDELNDINTDLEISEAEKTGTIPVKEALWWHPDLMLFLSDDSGGGVAVDRRTGAVWDWDHDGGLFGMLAPSIGIFFDRMATAFKEKRFTIENAGDLLWLPEISPIEEERNPSDVE